MRLAILAIVWTGLVLTLAAASTNATGDRSKSAAMCPSGHLHLVVADAQAEVYVLPPRNGPHGGYEPEAIYGCAYAKGHAYVLGPPLSGSSSGAGGVAREVLAGTILAYEQAMTSSGRGNKSSWLVKVRDLSSGKVLHEAPTGTPSPPIPGLVGAGFTTAIVVKTDGAVAWIVERPLSYEVHALDETGSRVLASGSNIVPSSLALAGSTIYWTQGGTAFSAPLD